MLRAKRFFWFIQRQWHAVYGPYTAVTSVERFHINHVASATRALVCPVTLTLQRIIVRGYIWATFLPILMFMGVVVEKGLTSHQTHYRSIILGTIFFGSSDDQGLGRAKNQSFRVWHFFTYI